MKKSLWILVAALLLFGATSCFKTKTLHCDYCQKEVIVKESSNMEEDWIIYCAECNKKLFGGNDILGEDQ